MSRVMQTHSIEQQRSRLAAVRRIHEAKVLPGSWGERKEETMNAAACEACAEPSVISLEGSFLCGRCLWAVSLLLRNRMPASEPAGAAGSDAADTRESIRQAIADVQQLRRRLVELGSSETPDSRGEVRE
jgi:hypothetical protein